MADPPTPPTPDDDDEKLARVFARGMEIYESNKAEREAKEQAAKDATKNDNGNSDKPPARSFRDRLLG